MPHCAIGRVSHGAHTHLGSCFSSTHMQSFSLKLGGGGGGAGAKMTVEDLLATQTRIEPQEKAHCVSCSFDANAANVFQAYVRGTLHFAVERVGLMFGTVDEAGAVKVEFIYEPPQEATATSTMLMRDAQEEKAVDFIAAQLGCVTFTYDAAQASTLQPPRPLARFRRAVLASYRSHTSGVVASG